MLPSPARRRSPSVVNVSNNSQRASECWKPAPTPTHRTPPSPCAGVGLAGKRRRPHGCLSVSALWRRQTTSSVLSPSALCLVLSCVRCVTSRRAHLQPLPTLCIIETVGVQVCAGLCRCSGNVQVAVDSPQGGIGCVLSFLVCAESQQVQFCLHVHDHYKSSGISSHWVVLDPHWRHCWKHLRMELWNYIGKKIKSVN